jgi:hypothetical protein
MKASRILSVAFLALICVGLAGAQTWQPLTNQPTFPGPFNSYLLTDGTIMVQDNDASDWWRLTPDNTGSYVNGTWTQLASLPAGYGPLYYTSAVLPDGRLLIEGGEYNLSQVPVETNLGAIYDPNTNVWTPVSPPAGWGSIGDASSVVLPNGTLIMADIFGVEDAVFNAKNLTWSVFPGTGKQDSNSEEGWTLLPDGTVLTVDTIDVPKAEKLDTTLKKWISAGSTPVNIGDPQADEIGPAILRRDGTVFAIGANSNGPGNTAIYTPPSNPADPGTWVAGPVFPGKLNVADGPAALLPSGNVLCQASPGIYKPPSSFFEFDGTNLNSVPAPPNAPNDPSYSGVMLVLPTGQVFWTDGSQDIEIYTPKGSPNPAWAPTITAVTRNLTPGQSYIIKGTQFNGLSQTNAYGDDVQVAENYPLVMIKNKGTGHIFFARTHDHSTMAVATGSATVSTHFDVPSNVETGASLLFVVAGGIQSKPVPVTVE